MNISGNVLEKTHNMIIGILQDNHKLIEEAYCNEEDSLSLSVSVKFSESKQSGIDIDVGINFVKERIKAKVSSTVDDNQMKLFKEGQ